MARLLVVDDDEYILDILKILLENEGYSVTTAQDSLKGLEIAKTTDVDIVISDLRMRPMNGIELLKAIRAVKPKLPVIMLTAYGSPETANEASQLGAFAYLTKPFGPDEVLETLQRALKSGGTPPPSKA